MVGCHIERSFIRDAMRRILLLSLLWLALCAALPDARAGDIEVRDASLRAADEGVVLNADFDFDLSARHLEAVSNGIPLYFVIEFDLTRKRWYWFAENTVSRRMQVRLSYHALSRHYRLSTGVVQQSFNSLEAAVAVLRTVRNWLVIERSIALGDTSYEAATRMRLDTSLLPKPIQLNALAAPDWRLESAWKRFPFRAPQQPPAPVESRDPPRTAPR